MTMAAKDTIGNFLEGLKILINHPFAIGDRVKIGGREYTVRDMDLRYLSLAREDGGVTMMTYSQLSEQTITIFREYAQRRTSPALRSLWTGMSRLVKDLPRPSLLKASVWTALGVGLAAALPFLPALLPVHLLTAAAGATASSWLPYAQGAMTLLATSALGRGVVGFVRRMAEDRGWQPQHAVVLRLAVQLGVALVGGTVALRFFGMTWAALLKSLGATSIAVGWTSSDLIGNLIQGFWILVSHPFAIGDQIEVGAVSGTVADMNLSYVVLEHADKSHTLVPYAVLKASPFTVLSKAPGQGALQ
jgi:small-conductance mechanosensitive channel